MARVKNSVTTRARRKKVLDKAEGYFGSKHRLYKTAHEQVMHSERYAYRDRKQTKRNFRKLWIMRINAECRVNNISYSRFIDGLNKAGVEVNRKMLSELAIQDKKAFADLVKVAKGEKTIKNEVKKETVKEDKKEEKKEDKKEEKADLSKLTVAELKELAKKNKVEGYSTMKKADLIAALK